MSTAEPTNAEMLEQARAFLAAAAKADGDVPCGGLDPRVRAFLIDMLLDDLGPEIADEMQTPERLARLELMRLGIDPWTACCDAHDGPHVHGCRLPREDEQREHAGTCLR